MLVEPLGQGGVAQVFRGVKASAGPAAPQVAIKRLHAELESETEFVTAFKSQAAAAMALQHPNVVRILDVGEAPPAEGSPLPRHYLAMELVAGPPLSAVLNRVLSATRQVPRQLTFTMLRAVLEALKHAHAGPPVRLPMVHGDVAPCNVLVDSRGVIKLADCGLMRARIRLAAPQHSALRYKWGYMAPEQARNQPVDHRADLYGVGVMLYEMLTQRRMRRGATDAELKAQVVAGTFPGLETSGAALDADISAMITRALQDNPAARFQSADELLAALTAYGERHGLFLAEAQLAEMVSRLFPEVAANEERAHQVIQQQISSWATSSPAAAPVVSPSTSPFAPLAPIPSLPGGVPIPASGFGSGGALAPLPTLPAPLPPMAPLAPSMDLPRAAAMDMHVSSLADPMTGGPPAFHASRPEDSISTGDGALALEGEEPGAAPWRLKDDEDEPQDAPVKAPRPWPVDPQRLMKWATGVLAVAVVVGGITVAVMFMNRKPAEVAGSTVTLQGPDLSRLVGGRTVQFWHQRLQRMDGAIMEATSSGTPANDPRLLELKARRQDLIRKAHALGLTDLASEGGGKKPAEGGKP